MKKKIFAISCFLLFLLFIIPACNSQAVTKDSAFNTMIVAHVVLKGNGTARLIGSNSLPGFGRALGMIVMLEDDGHVEMNKLFDTSNITKLDGSRIILLIWFIGFYLHENDINLNGIALLTVW